MKLILIISLIILIISVSLVVLIYTATQPQKENERISGAYQALTFFSEQRAYPYGSIPDKSYYAAFLTVQDALRKEASLNRFNVPPWESMGPHNTAGRTIALAFNPQNPNTIYAGSASGGLWRSKKAGLGPQAWEYVSTGFPVLAVCSIAIQPDDSNTIFIGTGEVYHYQEAGTGAAFRSTRGSYGIGILRTTNGGQSWVKSLDWSNQQRRGVQVVRFNPLNPRTMWAGTTEGTYRSKDNGHTWQKVHSTIMVWDLVVHPADTNIVVITCGNFASPGHGMYRTIDGGNNWSKIVQGVPATFEGKAHLDISRSHPDILYASFGNGFSTSNGATWLCRSSDAGATWNIVSTVDYSKWQGWFSHDVAISPVDTNQIIAIGIGVWKSTDGGYHLTQKSEGTLTLGKPPIGIPDGPPDYIHADNHDLVFHPANPDVVYFGNDGGVFRSTDAGETFESCNGGYQTVQFYNGFSSSVLDSHLALGGLQDNSTIIYDGDLAWTRVIGGDGSWTGINSLNDNILYASWQNLNILKSTNRGINWYNISIPFSSPTSFIAPFVVAPDNPQIIYAGRSIIYKSLNGGANWNATNNGQLLDGNPAIAMAVSPQNNAVVYAATAPYSADRGIFVTTNGGDSWIKISAGLPDRFPSDLYVNPIHENLVYLTFSGFGTPHIYKSSDYGQNWINISAGLPDVPASAVVVDPWFPDHIYLGNDIGVFASVDAGINWSVFNNGLPDAVMVFDLSISPYDRKLRVATHGNGAYQRDLIGEMVSIVPPEHEIAGFSLEQNYPNPFNPVTTLSYSLPRTAIVSLRIYNALGQKIRVLANDEVQTSGDYSVRWDGTNSQGIRVASGIYLYRLIVNGYVLSKRMILSK